MKFLKHIESYFYPILIDTKRGEVNPILEVLKSKGKLLLNNEEANLSYGGLHHVFEQIFTIIEIQKYHYKNVLILGMGAGSVISILREKYNYNGYITAIEKDQVVIDLARKYFDIDRFYQLNIIYKDAFEFTSTTNMKYDLIISDLFVNTDVPEIFASKEYLSNLKRIANDNCCIIYNKMTQSAIHKVESIELFNDFENKFNGSKIQRIYSNDVENSLLWYNTLNEI